MQQPTLFPEYDTPAAPPSKPKSDDYEAFVEKFKPKLTTDDCYTPPDVYDAVLGWVRRNCDIEGCNIVRPFYPGGDYQAIDYGPNDVVVDNPPFSIITKIVRWYMHHGVRFFLFAPSITILQPGRLCTTIACNATIIYDNGAKVNTGFVSNLFEDVAVMTAPDLYEAIESVHNAPTVTLPKYKYPANIVRATDFGKLAQRGIPLTIRKGEVHFVTRLDAQRGGETIFGGGYLISDGAAADRAAADRAAADRAAQQEVIEWTLSERERRIIETQLNK